MEFGWLFSGLEEIGDRMGQKFALRDRNDLGIWHIFDVALSFSPSFLGKLFFLSEGEDNVLVSFPRERVETIISRERD